MYGTYFDLEQLPFASVPQVDQYFPGAAIEAARTTLARCIERGKGAGMVVGPSGTGKTLLCRVLAEQFRGSFRVAMLSSGRLSTRRALLQAILYELGRPYRQMDEGELRLALVEYLIAAEECPRGMVLLVDEAHSLPLSLLEEIRMLTNVTRDTEPAVRLVIAGGSVLEERFASPKLDSFSQRLVARCYLEAFNRTETQEYIHARIGSAGGDAGRVFPAEACQSVYQATGGVPRLINQVCDHALLLAYVGGRETLEPAQIEEAWADLQQLPTPWNGESADQSADSGVIEFGGLDEQSTGPDAQPPTDERSTDGESAAPSLRISPEIDQAELPGGEPSEQLEQIEEMLAEVEEDFQPAGSIMPEVELVFDAPDDPFGEQFEHEEVVADRYTPPDEPAAEQPVEAAEHTEEEMVVDDEVVNDHTAVTCPITPVPRQEYGRLFARLRRG